MYEDGKTSYHAYKLNGKLTKECTGNANQANHWFIGTMTNGFMKWVNKGAIAWCEIQEVKTPYEVEKVVKKVIPKTVTEQLVPLANGVRTGDPLTVTVSAGVLVAGIVIVGIAVKKRKVERES